MGKIRQLAGLCGKRKLAGKEGKMRSHFSTKYTTRNSASFTLVKRLVGIPVSEIIILYKEKKNRQRQREALEKWKR